MSLDLTIVIPVRNEEKNLPGCLDSIGKDFAKAIIVLDSASTDNTIAIAETFGAQVRYFQWNGRFPKKRNWYLKNHPPATNWVLFLDADEYLTPQFKEEVRECLNNSEIAGYWLNYTIHFMGKKLKGGYPLRKLALFRPSTGEYERIDEERWSSLDMEVHEHPKLTGNTAEIRSKIEHLDFKDVTQYVAKHSEYAEWEARRFLNRNPEEVKKHWTWKQKLKYRLMQSVWIGPLYFFGSYFILRGFRDGVRGLSFAILKMAYFNQVYCKIQELKRQSGLNS